MFRDGTFSSDEIIRGFMPGIDQSVEELTVECAVKSEGPITGSRLHVEIISLKVLRGYFSSSLSVCLSVCLSQPLCLSLSLRFCLSLSLFVCLVPLSPSTFPSPSPFPAISIFLSMAPSCYDGSSFARPHFPARIFYLTTHS